MTHPATTNDPDGYACRFCAHEVKIHNLSAGCPVGNCRCMATPGESRPRTEEEQDRPAIGQFVVLASYSKAVPTPQVKSSHVEDVIKEADEWLNSHRVSETWRTMSRLRDTLVRETSR